MKKHISTVLPIFVIVTLNVLVLKQNINLQNRIAPQNQEKESTEPELLPVLYRDFIPPKNGKNIFIIESSRKQSIDARYLCGVESYCKFNSDGTVYLLLLVDKLTDGMTKVVEEIQSTYKNLKVLKMDIALTLQGTILANITSPNGFWSSEHLTENLSDLLRSAIIFKSGGFYSDTDIIAVRSITGTKNFLVQQEANHVASASFHFDAGHPYMELLLKQLTTDFKFDIYGTGVFPFTAALEKLCPKYKPGTETGFNMELLNTETCSEIPFTHPRPDIPCDSVAIYDPNAYYMVHWSKLERLFKMTEKEVCFSTLMKHGLGVHWGNSIAKMMWADPDSVIETLAERSCPVIFGWNGIKGVFRLLSKIQ